MRTRKYNPRYIPSRGDIVWLSFSPQKGHEQAGHRPAVVITEHDYNKASGLCIVVPVTSQRKGYPFEVPLDADTTKGVTLADHVRSIDWRARKLRFVERAPRDSVAEIIEIAGDLIRGL